MLYSILRKLSKVALLLSIVFLSKISYAALSDIQFGQYQIADSQWNVSACLYTTTCEIYSKQPGTAYKIPWYNGQVQWAAGDYVKLELSGDPNYPYVARQYSSTGVLKETLGTGKIVNMGPDYFFFVGNDDNTGQLFSGSSGMSDTSGVTWTGTLNPTIAQADAYADQNYSTTPLSPGQTATSSSPPPPPPTPVYSSGITPQQQTRKTNNLNLNPLGNNAQVNILGDDNIINIQQVGGRHFVAVDVQGNVNNVEILQTSTINARHYMEARVIGSNNDLILHQRDTSKTQFVEVIGTHNTVTTNQKGTGAHYLDVRVTGDNHSAGIIQDGSGSHRATVHLDGSQPWNFNLNQNSSTGQTYSLPHGMSDGSVVSGTCSAIGGCNLTINQQ
jgi:hypothetical protein